jgi:predicted  nucleic acid-binding Zn ribbon protein
MRGNNPAAKYARSTHCPKGHERTSENQSQGHKNYYGEHVRACAECKRERARIWAAGNYDTKKEEMRTKAREWQAAKRLKMTAAELEANRAYQRARHAAKKAKEACG